MGRQRQVVEMYISGKDKLGFINDNIVQPPQTDPSFHKWRTDNVIVKGWLTDCQLHSVFDYKTGMGFHCYYLF
jgi:hypothetical protein